MKSIKNYLLEKFRELPQIYCDMDGVLVDFDKGLTGLGFDQLSDKSKVWKEINRKGEQYWVDLTWLTDGKDLWNYLSQYNPIILTAAPNKYAESGKQKWIKENLGDVPHIICKRKDKVKYSGPNKILIDDREDTIKEWQLNGGIGILHKDTASTIEQLDYLLSSNEDNTIQEQIDKIYKTKNKIDFDVIKRKKYKYLMIDYGDNDVFIKEIDFETEPNTIKNIYFKHLNNINFISLQNSKVKPLKYFIKSLIDSNVPCTIYYYKDKSELFYNVPELALV